MADPQLITTAFDIPGYRIERSLGVARGIVVRSRSIVGTFGASIQTLFGGNISLYTSLCERARQDAYERMIDEARRMGGNAIVGMRYDATEIASGVTEVLCRRCAPADARVEGGTPRRRGPRCRREPRAVRRPLPPPAIVRQPGFATAPGKSTNSNSSPRARIQSATAWPVPARHGRSFGASMSRYSSNSGDRRIVPLART